MCSIQLFFRQWNYFRLIKRGGIFEAERVTRERRRFRRRVAKRRKPEATRGIVRGIDEPRIWGELEEKSRRDFLSFLPCKRHWLRCVTYSNLKEMFKGKEVWLIAKSSSNVFVAFIANSLANKRNCFKNIYRRYEPFQQGSFSSRETLLIVCTRHILADVARSLYYVVYVTGTAITVLQDLGEHLLPFSRQTSAASAPMKHWWGDVYPFLRLHFTISWHCAR